MQHPPSWLKPPSHNTFVYYFITSPLSPPLPHRRLFSFILVLFCKQTISLRPPLDNPLVHSFLFFFLLETLWESLFQSLILSHSFTSLVDLDRSDPAAPIFYHYVSNTTKIGCLYSFDCQCGCLHLNLLAQKHPQTSICCYSPSLFPFCPLDLFLAFLAHSPTQISNLPSSTIYQHDIFSNKIA